MNVLVYCYWVKKLPGVRRLPLLISGLLHTLIMLPKSLYIRRQGFLKCQLCALLCHIYSLLQFRYHFFNGIYLTSKLLSSSIQLIDGILHCLNPRCEELCYAILNRFIWVGPPGGESNSPENA